ncbi:hypothetical protein VUR80DRAFT_4714 [Thermomyces stellatus]
MCFAVAFKQRGVRQAEPWSRVSEHKVSCDRQGRSAPIVRGWPRGRPVIQDSSREKSGRMGSSDPAKEGADVRRAMGRCCPRRIIAFPVGLSVSPVKDPPSCSEDFLSISPLRRSSRGRDVSRRRGAGRRLVRQARWGDKVKGGTEAPGWGALDGRCMSCSRPGLPRGASSTRRIRDPAISPALFGGKGSRRRAVPI